LKLIRCNDIFRLLIAESYDTSDSNLLDYYGNDTHKGIAPFNFKFITHIHNNSDASYIKHILEKWLKLLPKNTKTNWVVRILNNKLKLILKTEQTFMLFIYNYIISICYLKKYIFILET